MIAEMDNPPVQKRQDDRAEAPGTLPQADGGYRVADLCRRWKVGADKVHGFLRRGELVGVNVATNLCGRPQYRITQESVRLFEKRRSTAPPPKPQRRRPAVKDYYPD